MKFKTYYRSLKQPEREAFAKRASTTVGYIENHLIHARKQPRKKLMESLAEASQGEVSYQEVVKHFFGESAEESAA